MVDLRGRNVGEVALGTARFAFGDGSFEQSVATVEAAVETGVVFVDTALAYTRPGVESYAESVVAVALGRIGPDRMLVATKGGHWRDRDGFPVDDRPYTLRRHVDISLRTLGVETLDLYFIHHPDPGVPIEESVGALADLRAQGKVSGIGLSNVDVDLIQRARAVAPIDAVQNRHSVARREDLPTLTHCAENGILYLAYQPFDGFQREPDHAVRSVAERRGVSVNRVMLAWLRAQSPVVLPIAGASRPETISDSGRPVDLDESDLRELGAMPHRAQHSGSAGGG